MPRRYSKKGGRRKNRLTNCYRVDYLLGEIRISRILCISAGKVGVLIDNDPSLSWATKKDGA